MLFDSWCISAENLKFIHRKQFFHDFKFNYRYFIIYLCSHLQELPLLAITQVDELKSWLNMCALVFNVCLISDSYRG
jgi:hypothetical protein